MHVRPAFNGAFFGHAKMQYSFLSTKTNDAVGQPQSLRPLPKAGTRARSDWCRADTLARIRLARLPARRTAPCMSRSAADSANPSRASPNTTPGSIETDAEADAQSAFASSSTPIAKPPLARLSSVSPHLSPSSPLLLESLTRSTLPSATLTASHASWVDLSRPTGPATSPPKSLLASTSASPTSPNSLGKDVKQSSERPTLQFRKRSASVGSLKALIERDRSGSAGTEAAAAAPRRRSSQLERPSALVEEDSPSSSPKKGGPDVSQLSWGKWWPFAVVDPADAESQSPPPPPTKNDSTESFLSLFAGKKAVQEAQSHHLAREEQDRLEAELLNASLEELDISAGSFALEADEVSREISAADARGKPLPRTPAAGETGKSSSSFLPAMPSLPNLFASSGPRDTSAPAPSSDRSSPSQSSSKAANGDGPSLLSSFAVPNPFTSSPAAFFPSIGSSKSSPRNSARPFSTSRAASKQKADGPDTKASEAKKMVDPEDRETIKEEEQVDLETFTLLKDKYRTPKLPIVFCHGLFGASPFLICSHSSDKALTTLARRLRLHRARSRQTSPLLVLDRRGRSPAGHGRPDPDRPSPRERLN